MLEMFWKDFAYIGYFAKFEKRAFNIPAWISTDSLQMDSTKVALILSCYSAKTMRDV